MDNAWMHDVFAALRCVPVYCGMCVPMPDRSAGRLKRRYKRAIAGHTFACVAKKKIGASGASGPAAGSWRLHIGGVR